MTPVLTNAAGVYTVFNIQPGTVNVNVTMAGFVPYSATAVIVSATTTTLNIAMLRQIVAPALAFQQLTGKLLYCGECGVIEYADPTSRRNWRRDFIAILR